MAQENVEIVKRWIELTNVGDVEAIIELLDPDIECFPAAGEPEAEKFSGRDEYRKRAMGAREALAEHHVEVSEFIDLGEYVAVVGRVSARGRASGVPVAADEVWLYRFKDGKCVEYRECSTRERALEFAAAAG
jgi:ketosteroid isomerase-like protein